MVVAKALCVDLHRHALPLEYVGGAGGGHQREAELDEPQGPASSSSACRRS